MELLLRAGESIYELPQAHALRQHSPKYTIVRNRSAPPTLISQFTFARDPAMDTCHSPGLSLSACLILATISLDM
jgi:hypothetical protein